MSSWGISSSCFGQETKSPSSPPSVAGSAPEPPEYVRSDFLPRSSGEGSAGVRAVCGALWCVLFAGLSAAAPGESGSPPPVPADSRMPTCRPGISSRQQLVPAGCVHPAHFTWLAEVSLCARHTAGRRSPKAPGFLGGNLRLRAVAEPVRDLGANKRQSQQRAQTTGLSVCVFTSVHQSG